MTITVILHIYYKSSWEKFKTKCKRLLEKSEHILISACHHDVLAEIDLDKAVLFNVSNQGKDIGGKLLCLHYYLHFVKKTDLLVFLHDKISPQSLNSDYWFNKLYFSFSDSEIDNCISKFNLPDTGMVGSSDYLQNEFDKRTNQFKTSNNDILKKLLAEFQIHPKNYNFIAGSMFAVRSHIFEIFFTKNPPLNIRSTLERGNVLDIEVGTYTHSWERILSFIVTASGYAIKGL